MLRERGTADDGLRLQNAVDDGVVRRAALRFVPSVGGFGAEAGAQFEPRRHLDGVFDEARAFKRAPAEFGGRRDDGEGLHRALQEGLQGAERSLAILVLRQQVVGLDALQPDAGLDLIAAVRPVDVIVQREEIARGAVVAAHVGTGLRDGDAPLEAVLPLMTMAPMGSPATQPASDDGSGSGEEVAGARIAEARGVEQRRRKDMLLLNAGDLLAQALVDEAERILRGRVGGAVVDGVDGEEQILAAEVVVEARGAEVFADVLLGMAEGFGDAARRSSGPFCDGPQGEQRLRRRS